MFRYRSLVAACAVMLFGATAPSPSAAISLPSNFLVENAVPGVTFTAPTGLAFLPDGRYLVAEKRGRVYLVDTGVRQSTPVLSIENEVLDEHDRGMLDVAVDPNFTTNRLFYVLYTVDPDGDGDDLDYVEAWGRLTRYRLGTNNVAESASRTILMGSTWTNGVPIGSPSHTIGALRWGQDGSLLVSTGDGALYTQMDDGGNYPALFQSGRTDPYENIGAFRSQSLSSLAGKVLRINPTDGSGYSSNPYWDGNASSKRSRIWCYGLRNPFRFCVRPGTGNANPANGDPGTLYVNDVGWTTWEETNVAVSGGRNFGWPCYEGRYANNDYQDGRPAHNGCGSFGTSDNPTQASLPSMSWHHEDPAAGTPPGFKGNCSVAGVFYTGALYPVAYRGRYFFADYGQNWIRVATYDANDQFTSVQSFATAADDPVNLVTDPITGDIFIVAIGIGQVQRLRYTGPSENAPPIAVATANPDIGLVPLNVQFSSAGTFDPDNDPISYSWAFGDGQGSTSADPSHTYSSAGLFTAVLTASDNKGGVGRDTSVIAVSTPGSFPTTNVLDSFNRPDGALGGSWTGYTSGLAISGNQLAQPSGGYASVVWSGATFGATQEAYVTLNALTGGATEHDLMLKVQGSTYETGHIEVRYDVDAQTVTVSTNAPTQGWVKRGGPFPITLVPGDRLGARAYPNGTIEIFRNATPVATASVVGWPFSASGGRVGMTITQATQSRFDSFGGGDAVLNSNTPPVANILSPAQGSFFVAGNTISLSGNATDSQDASSSLSLRWEVDLIHNTHTHPIVYTFTGPTGSFVAENHEDGTGFHYRIRFIATDTGGLSDTKTVDIHSEVDLVPTDLAVSPLPLNDTTPAQVSFTLRNLGRMLAPISRWQIRLDGTSLASGDTTVPALGSVTVTRAVGTLPGGPHVLRAVADTLAQVVETSESNNATTLAVSVTGSQAPSFPATAVLDDFNRANGALGGSWTGETSGLAIATNRLVQTVSGWNTVVWNGATFGPNQEAYVTLSAITAGAPEHDILLKMQGTSPTAAHLEVRYDDNVKRVYVGSYDPTLGWQTWATISQTFVAGDVLGARASSSGILDVYRNGTKIGSGSVVGWPSYALGGRLGLTLALVTASALDNFGGGNVVSGGSDVTPPTFTSGPTATPATTSAQVAWTTDEAATGSVRYGLTSSLGDSVLTPSGTSGNATLPGLTRNTTYNYLVAATDAAGNTRLSSLATFATQPNHNPVAAASGDPTSGPATLTVQFSSAGSSDPDGDPLSYSWAFGDGGVSTQANPSHAYTSAGTYTATLTANDGFGGTALSAPVTIQVSATDATPPGFTSGPTVTPSTTWAQVQWTTDEPARGSVRYGLTSSLGDSVLTTLATSGNATITGLRKGTSYFYRVAVTDAAGNTRLSALSGFTTLANRRPLAVATATPTSGSAPLVVTFVGDGSSDPDDDPITYLWSFGDGTTSTQMDPAHTYDGRGAYSAQLTVTDTTGESASATVSVNVSGRPSRCSATLVSLRLATDPDGSELALLGAAKGGSALAGSGADGRPLVWDEEFEPEQEAFVVIGSLDGPPGDWDLLLKVQGHAASDPHIEVHVEGALGRVTVSSHDAEGSRSHGSLSGVSLAAGDVFGARTDADGTVEVIRNGAKLGAFSVASWAPHASGGRVGLRTAPGVAPKLGAFGGGNQCHNSMMAAGAEAVLGGARVALSAAVPNPTRGSVSWSLTLAEAGSVEWQILDLQGRSVWRELKQLPAGVSRLSWRAHGSAPPGIYLSVVRAAGSTVSRRFVLLP